MATRLSLKTLAVVRDVDWERPGWQAHGDATRAFDAGLMHLVKPSTDTSTSTGSGSSGSRDSGERTPYPALETLWVALERADEVGSLESVLSNRAHSGVPLRRVVVTLYHAMRADAGSDVPARLRELRTKKMEKVMVMELDEGSAGGLREVDWLVRLPVEFSLPPAIHHDWPVIRHGRN